MDGFIFVGTNFRGLNKNNTFIRFKIHGHCILFINSYRKLKFRRSNSWITLRENHENWYHTKFKPSTVSSRTDKSNSQFCSQHTCHFLLCVYTTSFICAAFIAMCCKPTIVSCASHKGHCKHPCRTTGKKHCKQCFLVIIAYGMYLNQYYTFIAQFGGDMKICSTQKIHVAQGQSSKET